MASSIPYRPLFIILFLAIIGRVLLLVSGAVSFHSDEAIVGLMARHINAGARPTFFYGQHYMGSLDSWLVALAFRVMGESVLAIRIVQSLLYLLTVAVGYGVAWAFSRSRITAIVTGLVLAVPVPLLVVYSSASLGGYGEIMLLGGVILWLGYRAIAGAGHASPLHPPYYFSWAGVGLCAGVGWWVNGLIVVYLLPVALVGLYGLIQRLRTRQHLTPYMIGIALAAMMFVIGSAPWWVYDLNTGGAASQFYLAGTQSSGFGGTVITPGEKLLGLVLFGLPAVIGMRFPWATDYFLIPVGLIVLLIYIAAVYRLARSNTLQPLARSLLLCLLVIFLLLFIFSPFGTDPTGRYLLPLILPLATALGSLVDSVGKQENETVRTRLSTSLQFILVALVMGYNAAGQIYAARTAPGITTQFTYESHLPNGDDTALIHFLDEQALYHGYTHYWVAFRLAFLSGERMQYSPVLPYRADLDYNANDDRYPPYTQATQAAERIAYITTDRLPDYDAVLQDAFEAQDMSYQVETIGIFRVYYDFEPRSPNPPGTN